MAKRLLAMLLTVLMIFSLLPTAAIAEVKDTDVAKIGDNGYATLQAAFDKATNGDTVTMIADAAPVQAEFKSSGNTVTLDLNGHIISGVAYNAGDGSYTVGNPIKVSAGTLVIDDTKGDGKIVAKADTTYGSNYCLYLYGGNAVIENGTLESSKCAVLELGNSLLTVNGGKIVANGTDTQYVQAINNMNASLVINGGEIESNGKALFAQNDKAEVNGGCFKGTVDCKTYKPLKGGYYTMNVSAFVADGYACVANTDANAATYGYKVVEAPKTYVAQIGEGDTARKFETLADAAKQAKDGDTVVILKNCGCSGETLALNNSITVDLNGKTVTLGAASIAADKKVTIKDDAAVKGGLVCTSEITVNGTLDVSALGYGTSGLISNQEGSLAIGADGKVALMSSWDSFSAAWLDANSVNFFNGTADGAQIVSTEGATRFVRVNGKWQVPNAVAQIERTLYGVTYCETYATLAAAVTAANSGDTVVLLKDLLNRSGKNEANVVDKDITLDLNGHKIIGDYTNGGVINTYGNYSSTTAHLTITDNSESKGGYLENTNTGSTGCGIYQDGYSVLTLTNVSVKGVYAGVIQSTYYASGNALTVGTGASVTGTSYAGVNISSGYSGSSVTVDGGTISGGARGVMLGNSGASLTMNSGSITGTDWGVVASKNNCNITINGGTVTGTADYGIQAGTSYSNSGITIEVNDGTVSGGQDGIYFGGKNSTAVLNGGTVSGNSNGIYVGGVTSGTANSVTVAGGTVKLTGNGDAAIALWNGASLTMTSGTIESTGEGFAIANNGSNTVATTINISGGTVKAIANDSTAIYQAGPGTTTVSGGTITGYNAGVEVRNGTVNVSGGSITATADEFSCDANGSGTTTVGAALAIAQHTTKKDITVNITGGSFTGYKAVNECNPQANDPAPQVNMTVSDGEFKSAENQKVFDCADCVGFISGGHFSAAPDAEYIAAGKAVIDDTEAYKQRGYIYTIGIPVARILDANGNVLGNYETLQAAITAANENDTIVLLKPVEIASGDEVTIPANVTLTFADTDAKLTNNGSLNVAGTIQLTGGDFMAETHNLVNNGTMTLLADSSLKSKSTDMDMLQLGTLVIKAGASHWIHEPTAQDSGYAFGPYDSEAWTKLTYGKVVQGPIDKDDLAKGYRYTFTDDEDDGEEGGIAELNYQLHNNDEYVLEKGGYNLGVVQVCDNAKLIVDNTAKLVFTVDSKLITTGKADTTNFVVIEPGYILNEAEYGSGYIYTIVKVPVFPWTEPMIKEASEADIPEGADGEIGEAAINEAVDEIVKNTAVTADGASNIQDEAVVAQLNEVIDGSIMDASSQLVITVKSVATKTTETETTKISPTTITTTKASYNVEPWARVTTTVGGKTNTETRLITNEELATAVAQDPNFKLTFRLAVPESMTGDKVRVNHHIEGEEMESWIETVKGSGSDRYVELSATKFSDYDLINLDETDYVAYNEQTHAFFETLSGALDAATNGQTVDLLKDISKDNYFEKYVIVESGVTLDLQGHDLTDAKLIYVTGNLIDTASNKGTISAAAYYFASTETYLPIYNGTGYSMYNVKVVNGTTSDGLKYVFKLAGDEEAAAKAAIKGSPDRGFVKAVVTVHWTDKEGKSNSQRIIYSGEVFDKYLNTDGNMWLTIKFLNLDDMYSSTPITADFQFATFSASSVSATDAGMMSIYGKQMTLRAASSEGEN